MPTDTLVADRLDQELAGLDHLEVAASAKRPLAAQLWATAWPKMAAVFIAIAIWQFVVWREWKPAFVLPSPLTVWHELWQDLGTSESGALWVTPCVVPSSDSPCRCWSGACSGSPCLGRGCCGSPSAR